MKKKILILYAEYGSGHKSIAEYVGRYINEVNDNYEVKVLNLTEYANIAGKFGLNVMKFVSKYRPEKIFDFCYKLSDRRSIAKGSKLFERKSFDNKKVRELITDYNPDICISTIFFCSSIVAYYNKLGLINSKLITIITDYYSHEIWTINHENEDGFIVSNDIVKNELVKRGVPKNKIYPFGLPLYNNKRYGNELAIKTKYRIKNNKKAILFFGGSTSGSVYYYKYLKRIAKINPDVNLIFVSGKNEKLKNKADSLVLNNNLKNWTILGFTDEVFDLYRISDLVITKPGGATITECLEFNVPLLLVPGIGGQEKYNAKFIEKCKYGLRVRNIWQFKKYLNFILEHDEVLEKMKKNLENQNKNQSLEKINDLINKL